MPFAMLFWKKQLSLSIFVILVIVFSVFSSLPYSVNTYANEGTSTSLLQPIIPFFMNPSPSYQLQSTGNTTAAIESSSSSSPSSSQSAFTPGNKSITSSSSTVNTTGWNSVNTTLGIQFMVPPDWIADQFESLGIEGKTTPTTRGINFTSPESDNSFFMVNVTDNGNNNSQTTLSDIADSTTKSIPNITTEYTTTLSGLPAHEIISLREIQGSSPEEAAPIMLNITDLITTGNDKLYHIQNGAEVNDIASFSTFKDVLDTLMIDSAKSPSLNNTRANQTLSQNLSSSDKEGEVEEKEQENNDIDDMTSPSPVPLESREQNQSPPQSFVPPPMQQQQSPYIQQPSAPLAQQHPYGQPMVSSPYSSFSQPPYMVPQTPFIPQPLPILPPPFVTTPRILSSTHSVDNITGTLHIVGEVINESPQLVEFVKITATLFDAAGNVIGTEFAYADPDTLQPGQRAPFDIVVLEGSVPLHLMTSYALFAESDWQ
jgi:hypothetical protein